MNQTAMIRTVLIFDVETTGLEMKKALPQCSYIIQLSFMIYNLETNSIQENFNEYINIPKDVEIIPFIENLTKINRDLCDHGKPIQTALKAFYKALQTCDFVVAHNFSFDASMITLEFLRHFQELKEDCPDGLRLFHQQSAVEQYCTMRSSIHVCKIPFPDSANHHKLKNPNQKENYKYPKLEELYTFLFQEDARIDNLHNAMVDVLVCFKCFMKLKYSIHIGDTQMDTMMKQLLFTAPL